MLAGEIAGMNASTLALPIAAFRLAMSRCTSS
jgi:hypothetical protein